MIPSRRDFLLRSTALSAMLALPAPRLWAKPKFDRNPFALGVASGYPQPDAVVLWTRLAPDPVNGGGMPPAAVSVRWEIAADEGFRNIVGGGESAAVPSLAHSVHVSARGLQPARWYWYRFMAGDAVSATGRTRTAPAADDAVTPLSFAVASCQHYEHGYYAAYRDMARRNPDLVIHVGDYIYEASWGRRAFVRSHDAPEPYTLDDYRNRYALYKTDPQLQAAHAACPWLVTWDDHEVDNDYANDRSQDLDPVDAFLRRRAAAYQAYYEHMPLPPGTWTGGPDMKIYGSHAMGALARIQLLDMRQYRDYHVCSRKSRGGGGNQVNTAECTDLRLPGRSLLGAAQERWLEQALAASNARWNVIAQTTLMAQADREPGPERVVYTDGWDG
ncbi:MAG: alkaline phosphatase, partial [Burkholderiales bacterium]